MLKDLTFDEILIFYTSLYARDYGEIKTKQIIEKIATSPSISRFLLSNSYIRKIYNPPSDSPSIINTVNGILFFMFSANRTKAFGALLVLYNQFKISCDHEMAIYQDASFLRYLYNNEVRTKQKREADFRQRAIEIIKELDISTFNILSMPESPKIQKKETENNKTWLAKFQSPIFLLNHPISKEEYISRLKGTDFWGNESLKMISHNYAINLGINDPLGSGDEEIIEMSSYFDEHEGLLIRQDLLFENFQSPFFIFKEITAGSLWKVIHQNNPKILLASSSTDDKYRIEIVTFIDAEGNELYILRLHYTIFDFFDAFSTRLI